MINTECGIFALMSEEITSSNACVNGLKDLQHRGRESFGISYIKNDKIECRKHANEVFNILEDVSSNRWLGHVRYSTSGNKDEKLRKTQPIISNNRNGEYALAHNGNIPDNVWADIKFDGFEVNKNNSDTQNLCCFIDYLSNNYSLKWKDILELILLNIPGSYSLTILTHEGLYISRDRYALRPLGYIKNNNNIIISSENWALNGDFVDIKAGQIIYINNMLNIREIYQLPENKIKHCVFEYIYFLRGNSTVDGINANNFRNSLGNVIAKQINEKTPELANSWKNNNAIICGIPTSGIYFGRAIGESLDISYQQFITKRPDYPYRTFILKNTADRLEACKKKFQAEPDLIKNKIIILVDDSIVRGTTLKYLIKFMGLYEPKEIHFISGSPPVKYPCYYGMDFPDIEDLIANQISKEKMVKDYGLTSLTYLDIESLKDIFKEVKFKGEMCNACFTGNYLF